MVIYIDVPQLLISTHWLNEIDKLRVLLCKQQYPFLRKLREEIFVEFNLLLIVNNYNINNFNL